MLEVVVGALKAATKDDGKRGARVLVHLQTQSRRKTHGRYPPKRQVDRIDRRGAAGHRNLVSPHATNSPTTSAAFKSRVSVQDLGTHDFHARGDEIPTQ